MWYRWRTVQVPELVAGGRRGQDFDWWAIMQAVEDFRWTIDAFTPETIPMARLAEYMHQIAQLLGEAASVHFVRLEGGSTVLVQTVEREAAPKVRARVAAVRRQEAPPDAMGAYRSINRMLREDNGTAVLREQDTEVIRFPGREEQPEALAGIQQQGIIDGEVVRVGGADDPVPVLLKSETQTISGCYAARPLAKELARRLFEPVRLFGTGRWHRDEQSNWRLDRFTVDRFEPLSEAPLSSAVMALRAIRGGEWNETSVQELHRIRYGDDGAE